MNKVKLCSSSKYHSKNFCSYRFDVTLHQNIIILSENCFPPCNGWYLYILVTRSMRIITGLDSKQFKITYVQRRSFLYDLWVRLLPPSMAIKCTLIIRKEINQRPEITFLSRFSILLEIVTKLVHFALVSSAG